MTQPIPNQSKPVWLGPCSPKGGITYSLLVRFLECRERFRLYAIEGLREVEDFNHNHSEFGNFWHVAEAAGTGWLGALQSYRDKLLGIHLASTDKVVQLYELVRAVFEVYLQTTHIHTNQKPLASELPLVVPYTLPSGRKVHLRGKIDRIHAGPNGLVIRDTKTKGRIDHEGIRGTLYQNLQLMLYVLLGSEWCNQNKLGTIKQLEYNVIQRPGSSGDPHPIRQRKGRGKLKSGSETYRAFLARLQANIRDNCDDYFHRYSVTILDKDLFQFRQRTLHPILEQLCDWWEWMMHNDRYIDPWASSFTMSLRSKTPEKLQSLDCDPHGIHFQSPWGAYNSLAGGFRGSYFDLLTHGVKTGLEQVDTVFPELEGA